jgi:hypothetical protein
VERLLDDNGFMFSDDGKSYHMCCYECEDVPCVWANNQQAMINFNKAQHEEDTEPNKCHHALYWQMALIINDMGLLTMETD